MGFDLNVPYDVYLDTIDEPNGECSHYLFLRKDLFKQSDAEVLAKSFKRLIEILALHPEIAVSKIDISKDGELKGAFK
jgi:hypothetical protein